MTELSARLSRECQTIEAMIRMYCSEHHWQQSKGLCRECRELYDYTLARIEHCPHEENKPSCAKCPIHCFRADMRERTKTVMRYAGPRMLLRHPVLSLLHYLDSLRAVETPAKRRKAPPKVAV